MIGWSLRSFLVQGPLLSQNVLQKLLHDLFLSARSRQKMLREACSVAQEAFKPYAVFTSGVLFGLGESYAGVAEVAKVSCSMHRDRSTGVGTQHEPSSLCTCEEESHSLCASSVNLLLLMHAGWWIFADAVTVAAVGGLKFQALTLIPGIVATLAILLMNCAPRSELSDSVYGDDAAVVSCFHLGSSKAWPLHATQLLC